MRKHVEESWTGAAAGRGRGGRLSAGRKREVVLRLLRGEDLESVSRAVGITAARASHWRAQFLAAGQAGLKSRRTGCSGRRPSSAAGQDRRAADGDRVTVREGGPAGGRRPFGPADVEAMSGRPVDLHPSGVWRAPGLPRVAPRPLQCVCAAAGDTVPCAESSPRADRRCPGRRPGGTPSPGARSLPFHGEGYRKAWAKLRVDGIRTSQERVQRLMRESGLQAPPRAGHAHGPKAHDGTITTEAPDVMWGTDMTATVTVADGAAFVFVAVDHCATECIGLHAAKRGNRFAPPRPCRAAAVSVAVLRHHPRPAHAVLRRHIGRLHPGIAVEERPLSQIHRIGTHRSSCIGMRRSTTTAPGSTRPI